VRKAERMEHAGSALVYASYCAVVGIGTYGMVSEPAPSVAAILSDLVGSHRVGAFLGSTVWSALFVAFGVVAIALRIANRAGVPWRGERVRLDTERAEAVCLMVLGIIMLLYAIIIGVWGVFANTPGAGQTAFALLAFGLFLPGVALISLSITRRELLAAHKQSQRILTLVHENLRTNGG
jgi:hypothetical protein